MFKEKLKDQIIESVIANKISYYIEESEEEFDPTREYQSYADLIYTKIVENGFDIENDPRVQQIALGICNETIKYVLLGLSNQTTETPSERIDELLDSELGIKKPEQK